MYHIISFCFKCIYSLRREYPPLSLQQLQLYIDTNRVDSSKPIDLVSIINTGLYDLKVECKHAGVHLTDEVFELIFLYRNIKYYISPKQKLLKIMS